MCWVWVPRHFAVSLVALLRRSDVTSTNRIDSKVWRLSPWAWGSILGAVTLVCVFSFESLKYMVQLWSSKEEYGYAYIIPVVTLFMIWQKRETLERLRFDGSWAGVIVVLLGLGLSLLGDLSTLYIVVQYAFLVVLAGL